MTNNANKEDLRRAEIYLGIDVQVRRGCAFFALSAEGCEIHSGWGPATEDPARAADALEASVEAISAAHPGVLRLAIDAPRCPLGAPREWFWQGASKTWRRRRPADRGAGRHCEVVVSALRLGRPQWTPPREAAAPAWMEVGFALFERAGRLGLEACEVFPSASLTCLAGRAQPRLELSLAAFGPGRTDMLDALVAAATLREFAQGRGWEAPGGDGFGTIVLPARPSPEPPETLLRWPGVAGT